MTVDSKRQPTIMIIDDDDQLRNLLRRSLDHQYDCTVAASAEEAMKLLEDAEFDLVLTDINMGGMTGLELVPSVLKKSPDTVVVMVSGEQTIDCAIEAMRAGAFDYVTKPLDLRDVDAVVCRSLAHQQLLREKRQYEQHLEELVKERTAEVEHLAYYDRLTGLPNRTLFADRCGQALTAARRSGAIAGVIRLSLDQFDSITETLGHPAGDVILTEAASRLCSLMSDGETVARFDGDEFALLVTRLRESSDLAELAMAIAEEFNQPFYLGDHEIYLTTSTGIALFPANGDDPNAVVKNAGVALSRAKQQRGHAYEFYAPEMNARAVQRLALEASLRRAVENNELITCYQPVIDLPTGEMIGVEALVCWKHPELGMLPPAQFIGLAEDTGLILDIDEFVMRTACAQVRLWQNAGFGRLRVAVNISARHFQQSDFPQRVVQILAETRLDPGCLELELTETSIIENEETAVKMLSGLRGLGVTIAADDFGTGYSSLSYLKHLPIDTVKLDRSFVDGATHNADDAALVMAIVTLAHNLKLKVVAEGVETNEQLSFLRLLRCDEGQGYLFGRPMPAKDLERSLAVKPPAHARQVPNVVRQFPRAVNL
jgi:diguanylate cyclase (GGDEF)-like protein